MEFQGNKFSASERHAPGKMYSQINVGGMLQASNGMKFNKIEKLGS
jgi:hypothetical protein